MAKKQSDTQLHESMKGIPTYYRCSECGAVDRDRGVQPPPPSSLNCWERNCRGRGTMYQINVQSPEDVPDCYQTDHATYLANTAPAAPTAA